VTASAALALLASLALGAGPPGDPLADLQAALARLTARTPVAARFTVRYENVSGEGKEALRVKGEVGGDVADGPAGLELRWGAALLQQARDEERRHAADAEVTTPIRDGLVQVQAIELASRLDAAATLRDQLAGATLVEEREDQLDGAPVRLLVLKIAPALSARDRRYLKKLEAVGKLWLGADGVPLAAEADVHGKGRIFLIITFETVIRQSWRFARVGDRLVAVRHEEERHWEGAGDRGERRSSTVLELHAEPGHATERAPPAEP
jgi:hypothetical protein